MSELHEREQMRHRETMVLFSLWAAAILLAFSITGAVLYRSLHADDTRHSIETDRIAACTESEDVVGCLEALSAP